MNTSQFMLFDIVNEVIEMPPVKAKSRMFDIPALSFDRVSPGHITSSNFPLFRLPIELFPHVTTYLSKEDFNDLALVDRDCRRLAGPTRFKEVVVDLASAGRTVQDQLLLRDELNRRCIRRIDVVACPTEVKSRLTLLTQVMESTNGIQESSNDYDPVPICHAISTSFPNLHTLDWDGPSFQVVPMLEVVQKSSIKHLRLNGSVLGEHIQDSMEGVSCRLESLYFDVSSLPSEQRTLNRFVNHLLRMIAPTLRQLTWRCKLSDEYVVDPHLRFKNLRYLTLEATSFGNPSIVKSLIGPDTHIRSLSMDIWTSSAREFLCTRGNVSSLKHLSLLGPIPTHAHYSDFHAFLRANPQLETLHFKHPLSQIIIDEMLLPLLSSEFDYLTSLHLVSEESSFPESTLRAIGSISTLRHLWLSAGNQGFRSSWEVNHDVVRDAFSPSLNLETLAFSHDTYVTDMHPLAPRFCDYYTAKAWPEKLDISPYLTPEQLLVYRGIASGSGTDAPSFDVAVSQQLQMRRVAWEKWHRERMSALVKRHGLSLPSLKWCFVGQLPFSRGGDGVWDFAGCTIPVGREPCLFSLRKKMDMSLWRPV
ncbi:hypothetical protein CPC08DRAFT_165259 [Agrocybe pediades]|nr:hypothetical protein CPC08DRAFT_165259 [Agrocybe pediades]